MKITFDHNCLIHLESGGEIANCIRSILENAAHQCFVANVGASEMQRFGVRPDNYAAFEGLLARIGISHLPRLDPIAIWDVTFWDRCLWGGDKDVQLFEAVQAALFPFDSSTSDTTGDDRKELNRLCDVLTMWCHISYGNDTFATTDGNFFKATKQPKLIALGAGAICHPCDL
jgi:hypothetical protein